MIPATKLLQVILMLLTVPALSLAQEHGGGGGCGGGCGSLYGDLYVIQRNVDGVPVKAIINGVECDCYQPLDINGNPIALSPEGEVLDEELLVEVVFGRLNSARSPKKVNKMRFDDVITSINTADKLWNDEAGRLQLKYGDTWSTIDSPMDNLALYKHLMKYGHLQTDPFAPADPQGTHGELLYRPALTAADWEKIPQYLKCLLPEDGNAVCWDNEGNWIGTEDDIDPEPLSRRDIFIAACFLAAAADKTGELTVDLVQYLNQIIGIGGPLQDPVHADVNYFDFSNYEYTPSEEFDDQVEVLVKDDLDRWIPMEVDLLYWLHHGEIQNDPNADLTLTVTNIAAFVKTANHALRIIEFMHNYFVPVDLWPKTIADAPFVYQY